MLAVFLVDDEPIAIRGLKKLIHWEECGFVVSGEAGNGEEALAAITPDNTDIVITDLKMPMIDGLELSARLNERIPGIKIIVLTGFDDFPLMQQSIRNGVIDYLLKPVNAGSLIESLTRIRKKILEERFDYPFDLETRFINDINNFDRSSAIQTLDCLFKRFEGYKVPKDIICKICTTLLKSADKILSSQGSNLRDILREDVLEDSYLKSLASREAVKEKIYQLAEKIIKHKEGKSKKNTIREIKDYIDSNLGEDISLEMIASKFYLSPQYLSQLFKNETGENYVEYLMKVRVEKAKKLLMDKNMKIQDVSELVGYSDSKYFGQLFKKQAGMLPSDFRNNLKKV